MVPAAASDNVIACEAEQQVGAGVARDGQAKPVVDEQGPKRVSYRFCWRTSRGAELRRVGTLKLSPRHQGAEDRPTYHWRSSRTHWWKF